MSRSRLRAAAGSLAGLMLAACSSPDVDSKAGAGGAGAAGAPSPNGGMAQGGAPGAAGASAGGTGGSSPGNAGASPGGGGDAGKPGGEPRGPCELAKRVGRFSVEKQKDFGVVQGNVSEGVVPTSIPKLVLEMGGCQVLERRNLSCIPTCEGSQTCDEGGKCIPFPHQVSVGEVTIDGLTKAVVMSPQKPGAVYFSPGQDNPPFSSTANVVLHAKGADAIAGFELFGVGSEPLETAPTWELARDRDLALEWPAPSTKTASRVVVELTIDQHGMSPLSVSCRLEDTGSGAVPKEIVNHLIDSGVSGFPNGRLMRQTADHVDVTFGCVELTVGSTLAATVRVAGFTACKKDADCSDGQTCNTVLERCE